MLEISLRPSKGADVRLIKAATYTDLFKGLEYEVRNLKSVTFYTQITLVH